MEAAQRLSTRPEERGQAALGVSMAASSPPSCRRRSRPAKSSSRRWRARSRAAARARVSGVRHAPRRRAPRRRDVRAAARAGAGSQARRDGGRAQRARPDRAGLRGDDRPPRDRGGGARRGGVGRRPPARRGQGAARRAGGAGDDGRADRGPDRDRARGPAESRDRGVERGRRGGPGAELAAALLELPRHARVRPRVEPATSVAPRRMRSRRSRCCRPTIRSSGRARCPPSSTSTSSEALWIRPRRWCATPGRPGTCRCR